MNYKIKKVHINNIKAGDTVKHNNKIMTVCDTDIKYCSFMGVSLFGDSYYLGHKLVEKVEILKA